MYVDVEGSPLSPGDTVYLSVPRNSGTEIIKVRIVRFTQHGVTVEQQTEAGSRVFSTPYQPYKLAKPTITELDIIEQ